MKVTLYFVDTEDLMNQVEFLRDKVSEEHIEPYTIWISYKSNDIDQSSYEEFQGCYEGRYPDAVEFAKVQLESINILDVLGANTRFFDWHKYADFLVGDGAEFYELPANSLGVFIFRRT